MLDVAAAEMSVADPWACVPPLISRVPAWSYTLGGEVADLCSLLRFDPDPEQQLVLDCTFAYASDGLPAAKSGTVIAGRQNLKSAVFEMIAIGWMFVTLESLALWSAHEIKTTRENLLHLQQILEANPLTRKRIRVHTSTSDMSIIVTQRGRRQRLLFGTRTTEAGRGMSAPKTLRDEDLETRHEHVGASMAVTSTYPDAQTIAGSSGAKDYSEVLHGQLEAARSDGEGRWFHLEWGDDPMVGSCADPQCVHAKDAIGCRLDDPVRLKAANPAVGRIRASGRGLTWGALADERRQLAPQIFARERLTWHDRLRDDLRTELVFRLEQLERITDPTSTIVGEPLFGLDVAPKRAWSSIVAGGRNTDGRIHVEVTSSPGVPSRQYGHRPDTNWVAGWFRSRLDADDTTTPTYPLMRVCVLAGSEAMALVPALEKIPGLEVDVVGEGEYAPACGAMADAVTGEQLVLVGDPHLAVAGAAVTRRVNAERASGWSRRGDLDISPWVAATLVTWRLNNDADYDVLDSFG